MCTLKMQIRTFIWIGSHMRQILGKEGIKSVDKLRLYIMLNGLTSKRRVALPIKSICRKEILFAMVRKTNGGKGSLWTDQQKYS